MLTKLFRFMIFAFMSCLLLGYSYLLLSQRYGPARFKHKYEFHSDTAFLVNLDIDASEVKIRKFSRSKEVQLSIYFTEDEFKIYDDYDRKRSRLDIEFDIKGWMNNHNKDLEAEFLLELP